LPLYFGLPQGECFGFLGNNGAGKTTTMTMLTSDVLPTAGTATLRDFDILSQQLEVRRQIGYRPQFDALFHLELFARIISSEWWQQTKGNEVEEKDGQKGATKRRLAAFSKSETLMKLVAIWICCCFAAACSLTDCCSFVVATFLEFKNHRVKRRAFIQIFIRCKKRFCASNLLLTTAVAAAVVVCAARVVGAFLEAYPAFI
jgi:translation initiation factor RLI1